MYVKFSKLPPAARERLKEIRRGEGEVVVKPTGSIRPYLMMTGGGVLWLALLFLLADDYRWGTPAIVVLSAITLAAGYVMLFGLYNIYRRYLTGPGSFFAITRRYAIDADGGRVSFRELDEISGINSAHDYQGSIYRSTKIELWMAGGDKELLYRNINEAEDALEKIEYLRKSHIEASAQNDRAYLGAHDDFRGARETGTALTTMPGFAVFPYVILPMISVMLLAAIMYPAIALNEYFDDKRSWAAASSANRAAALRNYLSTHPQGRWTAPAGERLNNLYDEAELKYISSLKEGYDHEAAEAMIRVLRYARSSQNFRVKVGFARKVDIPENLIEQLKKDEGVKTVLPLHDVLSPDKLAQREDSLFKLVANSFGRIIPNDILEFSLDCPAACVDLSINYTLEADSIYYPTKQKNMAREDRTYYPGILLYWDSSLVVPDGEAAYEFEIESIPANQISYDSELDEAIENTMEEAQVLKANKSNIYESMISSAFSDLRSNLLYRFGIGNESDLNINKPLDEEEKTSGKPDA